jgi:hypothetical protein
LRKQIESFALSANHWNAVKIKRAANLAGFSRSIRVQSLKNGKVA